MIIQCSGCQAKYKIEDNKIPPAGLKISCKKCLTPIPVRKPDNNSDEKVSKQEERPDTEMLEKIVSKTGDLPPMPHIAMKVLEIVGKNNTTNEDLRKLISQDQSLTAQILKFSNSSMYSCVRAILTLSDALVVLGYNTLKSLIVTSSTQAVYKSKGKVGFQEKKLWEHSVATGLGARIIGEHFSFPKTEEAFIGGLLHDIGKVVLCQGMPDEYNEIIQEVYNSDQHFIEVERNVLGFDHADVGYMVVKKWNFAEELESTIHFHHHITKKTVSGPLLPLINLADNISNKNGFGLEQASDIDLTSLRSTKCLKLSEKVIEGLEKKILNILETDKEMLNL